MKGRKLPPRRYWIDTEVAVLQEAYHCTPTSALATRLGMSCRRVSSKASALGLRKSPAYLVSTWAGQPGGPVGERTRFQKGNCAWNKGMKGIDLGGRETWFRPGHKPANSQDVGALRITTDGLLMIKLGPGKNEWKMLSHYSFFVATGKWPRRGYVLRTRNGDPYDTQIENLELLTQRENMRRNSVHTILPPGLARLVQLRGALERQINQRQKRTAA